MSIDGQLSALLTPLREQKVRLLVPLFVDTFPLGHFYASEDIASKATDLVKVVNWNDTSEFESTLAQAAVGKTPVGIYVSADMARKLSDFIVHHSQWNELYTPREIPVSTLQIRRFFVPPDSTSGHGVTSVEGLIESCRDVETILIHSDFSSHAEAGHRYLKRCIGALCSSWPSRPNLVWKRADLSLSLFRQLRSQKLRHIYWLSEVGQAALRKTARNFIEVNIADEPNQTGPESVLEVLLLVPNSMKIDLQGKLISCIEDFHENLFSRDESSLNETFDLVWQSFMLLFVTMKWPIFNLFESVEEYTRCFRDHHVFNGRRTGVTAP